MALTLLHFRLVSTSIIVSLFLFYKTLKRRLSRTISNLVGFHLTSTSVRISYSSRQIPRVWNWQVLALFISAWTPCSRTKLRTCQYEAKSKTENPYQPIIGNCEPVSFLKLPKPSNITSHNAPCHLTRPVALKFQKLKYFNGPAPVLI